MKSHEIFQHMSPDLAAQVFTFLQTEQKPVYKAAIQGLANQRNLRGVFYGGIEYASANFFRRDVYAVRAAV